MCIHLLVGQARSGAQSLHSSLLVLFGQVQHVMAEEQQVKAFNVRGKM